MCTAGRNDAAVAAIASLLKQSPQVPFEVILVDNSPEDSDLCRRLPTGVRYVREPSLGLSRARNRGAAQAHGRVLLFIDDDAEALPSLAAVMAETFAAHPKTAIVGGQIFLVLPRPRPPEVLPGKEGLWSAYTVPYTRYREIREQYEFPYGACFAIRKAALEELGGFPENYGRVGDDYAGGEETALCFMCLSKGWSIGIQPQAQVNHRVDPARFTRVHIRQTLRAGIFTTYRLYCEGYAQSGWTPAYVRRRISICRRELARLRGQKATEIQCFYKQCELDAFEELLQQMKKSQRPETDGVQK